MVYISNPQVHFTDYTSCGPLRAAFRYCFHSLFFDLLWALLFAVLLFLCLHPHVAMSDSPPISPSCLVGQHPADVLVLWWLSLDDVGLQVWHLVREVELHLSVGSSGLGLMHYGNFKALKASERGLALTPANSFLTLLTQTDFRHQTLQTSWHQATYILAWYLWIIFFWWHQMAFIVHTHGFHTTFYSPE